MQETTEKDPIPADLVAGETKRTETFKELRTAIEKLAVRKKGRFEASCSDCGTSETFETYPNAVIDHVCPACGNLRVLFPLAPKPLPCEALCDDLCPFDEQEQPRPVECRKRTIKR